MATIEEEYVEGRSSMRKTTMLSSTKRKRMEKWKMVSSSA